MEWFNSSVQYFVRNTVKLLFNAMLGPFIENLDMNQVNLGISSGELTLRNLKLKKSALDKFHLPVDVVDGYLGEFTFSANWLRLMTEPTTIEIRDMFLVVVPRAAAHMDPAEEEKRELENKLTKLQNAELLEQETQDAMEKASKDGDNTDVQSSSWMQATITKIINNVYVTVENIHIRYEDKTSVPKHPFAAGFTVAEFSAVPVDDGWNPWPKDKHNVPASAALRKLARLESLCAYFDTNASTMAGLPQSEIMEKMGSMIPHSTQDETGHQFLIQPISAQGKVTYDISSKAEVRGLDAELLLDDIGLAINNWQYQDLLYMVDMYHVFLRRRQYLKYRPSEGDSSAKARLNFAGNAILAGVRERRYKWTWDYFAQRRDDRKKYCNLYHRKRIGKATTKESEELDALEKRLSYWDIRFYRSIVKRQAKKSQEKPKQSDQQAPQQSGGGWWFWGKSSASNQDDGPEIRAPQTRSEVEEVNNYLGYDLEEAMQAGGGQTRVSAKLKKGTFTLRHDIQGTTKDMISLAFDQFHAQFMKRQENVDSSLSLLGLSVIDGTTENTLYRQIVQVKSSGSQISSSDLATLDQVEPFFSLRFEHKPLDGRADNALELKMRHMEIIYHKKYVEAVYNFFKPPTSQLESIEALLNVASQTFEEFRNDTRTSLEHALLTHKTIDIRMDMNAPIIIVVEDPSRADCAHLILDAGHIAIQSELANRARSLNRSLSEPTFADFMYDKFLLRLDDAQFVIGKDLVACRNALISQEDQTLHLLQRLSIDVQLLSSIVPEDLKFARFKVSGKLPKLKVNFSDTKYLSLLRLIDVSIPKFGDDPEQLHDLPPNSQHRDNSTYWVAPVFSQPKEYIVADDDNEDENANEEFYEAEDGSVLNADVLRRHSFELTFDVRTLQAHLAKTVEGIDKTIGVVSLDIFSLKFGLAKYSMTVEILLRSMALDILDQTDTVLSAPQEPIRFLSTSDASDASERDLLNLTYTRVQRDSPEFERHYEGIEQHVDVRFSTFVFKAAPEPVITAYDFIMSTFVNKPNTASSDTTESQTVQKPGDGEILQPSQQSKIKVRVHLDGVKVLLLNGGVNLATLSLSTAYVAVTVRPKAMLISGRVSSLSVVDDSNSPESVAEILSIKGQDFADFYYETFDQTEESYPGYNTSFIFNAGSIHLYFLERPLHEIYVFVQRLATLKGLLDASQLAAQKATESFVVPHLAIVIKSPVIYFPSDVSTLDSFVMKLGEINASNSVDSLNKIDASLKGIQLTSVLHNESEESTLKIIDDINVDAEIISGGNEDKMSDVPETRVVVKVSDVRLHLTQIQYNLLLKVMQSIPRVAQVDAKANPNEDPPTPSSIALSTSTTQTPVGLTPEISFDPRQNGMKTTLDVLVTVNVVKLHLYDSMVFKEDEMKDHGIMRFALNENSLRLKMLSDGATEAQVVLKSFVMGNTRRGASKFRQITSSLSDRNQFMILYNKTGGVNGASVAIVTVDSPQVIFAVDPVISLLSFITSPFQSTFSEETQSIQQPKTSLTEPDLTLDSQPSQPVEFRVDLHDVAISVLEDDTDMNSQAIKLYIEQVSVSQQGVLALNVKRLGMSLLRMGKPSDDVRFLDDVDITCSLDSRSASNQQVTNIGISSTPIIFRASYRDIMLISAIANKAVKLYGESLDSNGAQKTASNQEHVRKISAADTISSQRPSGTAHVSMSKEQLNASFDGLTVVLIGDMYEQPMLHFWTKRFIVGAKDWSGELRATSTISTQIKYWNLTNSHWEPLIDPWTFTATVSKQDATSGLHLALSSRERIDVNVSSTFAELAISTVNLWSKEGGSVLDKPRGSYAPYQIRNLTGSPLLIWADQDTGASMGESSAVKVSNGETIDWRFDDWKTTREHFTSSSQHNIGIQFVGKHWEHLKGVTIDREGEFTFSLRPRLEKFHNRLLCEVRLVENTKLVTIRSTYRVQNDTLYPLELTLVDLSGHPVSSLEKLAPGQDYALPLDAVATAKLRLQPDQGFGYKWSTAYDLDYLLNHKASTIKCSHSDPREASFRFQSWTESDTTAKEFTSRARLPKLTLKLRAPMELENLLPFNIQFRIYNKDTDKNWRSYLRQGGIMPIHSVELSHLVLLSVEIQDTVFKPSDFSIINTNAHSDFDIEHKLTVQDLKGRRLDLRLNYVRYPNSGGAFKVQIYCPYIVINKTGCNFDVKSKNASRSGQESAGDPSPELRARPAPFMLSPPREKTNEFMFRLGASGWSKFVNVEAPAAETSSIIPMTEQRSQAAHIGLSWSEGLGKYKLSKIITLAPRFLVRNTLEEPIAVREHGVGPNERSVVGAGERTTFITMLSSATKFLVIAFPGLNAQWSAPINIGEIGVVHTRVYRPNARGVKAHEELVKAEIRTDGPSIFIILSSASAWPFRIENESEFSFDFAQTDDFDVQQSGDRPKLPDLSYCVPAKSSVPYAWDLPSAAEKRLLLKINSSRRKVDLKEIGNHVPFKFTDNNRSRTVSLDVRADDEMLVLRISNYSAESSVYRPRRAPNRQDSVMSMNTDAFEAIAEDDTPLFSFSVDFAGLGISLINKRLVEVIYASLTSIKFEYASSPVAQSVDLSFGSLQIDNQLHDALYPVILQPTPISKETGVAALPTVQARLSWLNDQEHGVLFIKYASILLQALTVEADEDLLFSLYDLTQIKGASWEEGVEDVLISNPGDIPDPSLASTGQQTYFETLQLHPVKLLVSFMRTERVSSEEKLSIRNPVAVVVNALTMAVGNINDASLEMNALAITDMRLTAPELQNNIMYHYRQEVIRQLYRLLGSADFIGNPVGLFTNVSSGVMDIFYEPINGVLLGKQELGIGIAKGAASFVKKTVFGLTDSMAKFTSSVGKGLSAATFDPDYQARRRMAQRRNKPRHAIYGVTAGGEAFANSIGSAVEGVLVKPIEGADREGAAGFFKGLGKGVMGAMTKPVVGAFDFAANVSEGIRNTTTVFDKAARDRVRLPRFTPSDHVLRSYSDREALGQYWMKDLEEGAYRKESYVAHINPTLGEDNVVLLTTSRILCFRSKNLRLEWELPLSQIQGVAVEDTGIRFSHKAGKESDKFISLPERDRQSWFFNQIGGVVKQYNKRKRMD